MTFFNILSKSEAKESEKPNLNVKIIIDNREKNSLVPSELISLGFQIEFQQLPVADYIINEIAIERKTFADFQSSIINKRIFSQLEELKQYPSRLLIIEKSQDKNQSYLGENALRGALLCISLKFQTPIIFTEDEKETAKYIQILASKKEKESSIRASKIFLSDEQQVQFILEGFPRIGPKTAKKLIEKFHSLEKIFNATEEQLSSVLKKQTREFIKILSWHL